MTDTPQTVMIAGPTASGKSDLAIEIAQKIGGEIVNADALQIYECYEVLTARPPAEDLAKAPHHLYGHIPNRPGYSVGSWLREVIALKQKTSKPLIFVGGTGLYFHALLNGLTDIPEISEDIRQELNARLENEGLLALQNELKNFDPKIVQRIDMQNPRRVLRAHEVYAQTGTPLSAFQDNTPPPLYELANSVPLVLVPPRELTNAYIEKRFHKMIELGALDEVKAQMHPWDETLPANQALGAKELAGYLQGDLSLQEAIERAVIATRQYAKRQRSWFRSRMKDWIWLESNKIPEIF